MISTSDLYSHNGERPNTIPNRIRFPDGTTKTDIATFTVEDITAAGYTGPYNVPEYDPDRYIPKWNSETMTWDMEDHPIWIDQNRNPSLEEEIGRVREYRDYMLFVTDWTQMPDTPITDEKKAEFAAYRQELRDVPAQENYDGTYDSIIWPTRPEV